MAEGEKDKLVLAVAPEDSANSSSTQLRNEADNAFNEAYFSARRLRNDISGLPPEDRRKWLNVEIELVESQNPKSREATLAKRKEQFPELDLKASQLLDTLKTAEDLQARSEDKARKEYAMKKFGTELVADYLQGVRFLGISEGKKDYFSGLLSPTKAKSSLFLDLPSDMKLGNSLFSGARTDVSLTSVWAKREASEFSAYPTSVDRLKLHQDEIVSRFDAILMGEFGKFLRDDMAALFGSKYASADEKTAFVKQVARLMDGTDPKSPTAHANYLLALLMIRNAGSIDRIDQGSNGTCAIQSLEKRLIARNPGLLSEKMVDLMLNDKFEFGTAGSTVSLKPEWKYSSNPNSYAYPPIDGERNFASHVATMVLANARFELHNKSYGTQLRYGQHEGKDALFDCSGKEPKLVYGVSGKKVDLEPVAIRNTWKGTEKLHKKPVSDPMVSLSNVLDTYEAFTGQSASKISLQSYDAARLPGSLYQLLTATEDVRDKRALVYRNPGELEEQLLQAKQRDAYPLLFQQPGHLTTVNYYDSTRRRAGYDNQWGKANDAKGGLSPESLNKFGDMIVVFK